MELDRESPTYRRATNAGWTFSDVTVDPEPRIGPEKNIVLDTVRIEGEFQCVCGRREKYSVRINKCVLEHEFSVRDGKLDIALWLSYHGSFSREHLLEDGYTEEQIRSIEAKFDEPLADEARSSHVYYGTTMPVQSLIPN